MQILYNLTKKYWFAFREIWKKQIKGGYFVLVINCPPLLTFFTLCGFFSLRHLRMSISVVLTQPGCGRRQETQRISGSDDSVSPACKVCTHTIQCCSPIQQCQAYTRPVCKVTDSVSATNNKKKISWLIRVKSWFCSFQALNIKKKCDPPFLLFFVTFVLKLTTGRWTSQNALSWLSKIFLSALSFFLSILSAEERQAAHTESTHLWNIRSHTMNQSLEWWYSLVKNTRGYTTDRLI